MPFTLAHPAAVMPLRRIQYLPTIALVVGSMTPDVPYYLPSWANVTVDWPDMHTLNGSIVLGIPLGMVLVTSLLLMRRPLTALMSARARWVALREADAFLARPVNWLLAIPALLIGSWTHIVWDGFTHGETWISRRVDALNAPVHVLGIYTGEMSHVLQYVSSIVGLVIVGYWYKRAVQAAPPEVIAAADRPRRRRMLAVVIVAAIAIGTVHAVHGAHPTPTVYRMLYLLLTRIVAWFMLLYVLAGALLVFRQRARPQPESRVSDQQARSPQSRADHRSRSADDREKASL
jgi:hypothetical protein